MTEAVRSRATRSLSSCSYFNKKYLSFYELYLKLLKAPSSMFCTVINSVVLSQFEELIRDDREYGALVIKFLKGGVFLCPCLL